jgi:hypothetical protein
VATADEFTYRDPIDGSISYNQGKMDFKTVDGSLTCSRNLLAFA